MRSSGVARRTGAAAAMLLACAALAGCSDGEELAADLDGMPGITEVSTSCVDAILDPSCHTAVTVEQSISEENLTAVLTAMFSYSSGRHGYVGTPDRHVQVTLDLESGMTAGFAPEIARAFTAVADLETFDWAALRAQGTSYDDDPQRSLWIEVNLPAVSPTEAMDPGQFAVALHDLRATLDALDGLLADFPDVNVKTEYGLLNIYGAAAQDPNTSAGYPEASIDLFLAIADRHPGIRGSARPGALEVEVFEEQTRVETLQILDDLDVEGIGPLAQMVEVSVIKPWYHGATQSP